MKKKSLLTVDGTYHFLIVSLLHLEISPVHFRFDYQLLTAIGLHDQTKQHRIISNGSMVHRSITRIGHQSWINRTIVITIIVYMCLTIVILIIHSKIYQSTLQNGRIMIVIDDPMCLFAFVNVHQSSEHSSCMTSEEMKYSNKRK